MQFLRRKNNKKNFLFCLALLMYINTFAQHGPYYYFTIIDKIEESKPDSALILYDKADYIEGKVEYEAYIKEVGEKHYPHQDF